MTPPVVQMPAKRAAKPPASDATRIATTLGELVRAQPALARILQVILPTKLGYHLAKLGRLVEAELAVYHERRIALIKEFGEERIPNEAEAAAGATQMFQVKPEHLAAWRERMKTLDEIEVVLQWAPFALADVPDGSLSGGDIMTLGALVVEKAGK